MELDLEVGSDCVRFPIFRGYSLGGMGHTEDLTSGESWRLWCGYNQKTRAAALPDVWPEMRRVIVAALADFPEARAAVAAAIRPYVSEDET